MDLTNRLFSVNFDSRFKQPLLLKEARYDEVARKSLETFSSYGLKPTQIIVRADFPFNHNLSFTLFNGNAAFKLASENVDLRFENAVSAKDFEIVADCVSKAFKEIPLPEISSTFVSASMHATAPSKEALQQYLLRFADPKKQIVRGGAIAHVVDVGWPQEIRVTVESSLVYPDGVFLTWQTNLPEQRPSQEILKNLNDACEQAATRLDLVFPKPPL